MAAPYQPAIGDLFNPYLFQGMIDDTPIPAGFIGDEFLPPRPVAGDRFSWQMVRAEAPMASFSTPDSEAPRLTDEQLSAGFAEVAYIKQKRVLDHSDMRLLAHYGLTPLPTTDPVAPMATVARQNLARQSDRVLASVRLRKEWMQVQTLRGKMTVAPDAKSDVKFEVDYGVSTHTASPLWSSHSTADPVGDLYTWFGSLTYDVKVMITSRANLLHLLQNDKIRSMLYLNANNAAIPTFVSREMLNSLMDRELGIRIVEYNTAYTVDTDTGPAGSLSRAQTRILPATEAIFLPAGEVGFTAEAPAPEKEWATGEWMRVIDPNQTGFIDPMVWQVVAGWYGFPVLTMPTHVHRSTVSA